MTRDGKTTLTDVCLVIPRRHGFEHWPHPIERLEIYDVRFVAWQEGDPSPEPGSESPCCVLVLFTLCVGSDSARPLIAAVEARWRLVHHVM